MEDLDRGPLVFDHDAASLAVMTMVNLTCATVAPRVFSPAATPTGFDELIGSSVRVQVGTRRLLW